MTREQKIDSFIKKLNTNTSILYELVLAAESADLKRAWSVEKAHGILGRFTAKQRVALDLKKYTCSFEELASLVKLYEAAQYFAFQFKARQLSQGRGYETVSRQRVRNVESVKLIFNSDSDRCDLEIHVIRFELFVNLFHHINWTGSDGGAKGVWYPDYEHWKCMNQLVIVYDYLERELGSKCAPFTKHCQAQQPA